MSDWNSRPLTDVQLIYAALDAHCLVGMLARMLTLTRQAINSNNDIITTKANYSNNNNNNNNSNNNDNNNNNNNVLHTCEVINQVNLLYPEYCINESNVNTLCPSTPITVSTTHIQSKSNEREAMSIVGEKKRGLTHSFNSSSSSSYSPSYSSTDASSPSIDTSIELIAAELSFKSSLNPSTPPSLLSLSKNVGMSLSPVTADTSSNSPSLMCNDSKESINVTKHKKNTLKKIGGGGEEAKVGGIRTSWQQEWKTFFLSDIS